jgi:hypothetical protein
MVGLCDHRVLGVRWQPVEFLPMVALLRMLFMMYVLLLATALAMSGCAFNETIRAISANDAGGVICVRGSTPMPQAPRGNVTTVDINKGFKGTIKVSPDCNVELEAK